MTRRAPLLAGACLLLAFAVLAVCMGVAPGMFQPLDDGWNAFMEDVRSDAVVQASLVFNAVGGGWIAVYVLPLILAIIAGLLRGWRVGIVVIVALAASAGVVQLIKHLIGRARPLDLLVPSDFGSFPSGHTANAATVAVVLLLILPRVAALIVGIAWTVLMALSRTVLSVHWLTDTVGGALLGAGIALLVVGIFASWAVRPPVVERVGPAPAGR